MSIKSKENQRLLYPAAVPLARKKLSEQVEDELEKMIRMNQFQEGDFLPSERDLMAMFNVGRPSIREALANLKRKGLVQINNGERSKVCRPKAENIIGDLSVLAKDFLSQPKGIDYFEELRLFFEISLVRHAAMHATDDEKKALQKALIVNEKSCDNLDAFVRSDIAFHRILAEIPRNPVFSAVHSALLDWLLAARQERIGAVMTQEKVIDAFHDHVKICDAIVNSDPDLAERCLKEHLHATFSWYK